MSCAVGLAVLDVIEKEDLRGNAIRVGSTLKKLLTDLHSKHEIVGDVRGVGLFVGIELVTNRELKTPATKTAAYVVKRYLCVNLDSSILPKCFNKNLMFQIEG